MFLDAVMEEYIVKTEGLPFMDAARRFAMRHRAVGVGVLGWHSFLQSKMIAFESAEAKALNKSMHEHIFNECMEGSKELAAILGEPELLKGYGRRNTTVMAIAPTTSSSFILGQVSPSIEPLNSNYFTKDLQKGKFGYKNPHLKELLSSKGQDTKGIWDSILLSGGSVQHLDFLNAEEKAVFKTFGEIPQIEIIIQAADRQKFLDQGQSLNLMIHPDAPLADVNKIMIEAWKQGVKTLYYQRSTNPSQELARELLSCKSCEA
jgi:ribonucleoside-diphosphate reductase alpha chain